MTKLLWFTVELVTWGFCKNSDISVGQNGHFFTIFCALRVRPPSRVLSRTNDLSAYESSKQDLQKLCPQGVVSGRVITFRHSRQQNSATKSESLRKTGIKKYKNFENLTNYIKFNKNIIFKKWTSNNWTHLSKASLLQTYSVQPFLLSLQSCFHLDFQWL